MRKCLYMACAGLLFAAVSCTVSSIDTPVTDVPEVPQNVVEGELLVRFSPAVSDILDKVLPATKSGAPATRSGMVSVDEVLEIVGAYELERVFPLNPKTEEKTRKAGLHLWYIVRYSDGFSAAEVAEKLSALGEVSGVEYNRYIRRSYNARPVALTAEMLASYAPVSEQVYNDPLLPYQWNMVNDGTMFGDKSVADADVDVKEAWNRCKGNPEIVVAVLDEGVCITHPELRNNLWVNEGEEYGSDTDADGNGYRGDKYGYNFINESGFITTNDFYDTGHGTHVAGVIAARNDNGMGISSIAGGTDAEPGVRIMSCQIFSGDKLTTSAKQVAAIKYAADNGAHIIQCSWGYVSGHASEYDWGTLGYRTDEEWIQGAPIEKSVLDYFVHNAGDPDGVLEGGIAIFASGNEAADMAGYPGAYKDYVSVAATAADFTPASYTNYGYGTTISAPGGDPEYYVDITGNPAEGPEGIQNLTYKQLGAIISTVPPKVSGGIEGLGDAEGGYALMEGTSMACPHVSGVAALGLSYAYQLRKHFTAEEFIDLLYKSAVKLDDKFTGSKVYYTMSDPNSPVAMPLEEYKGNMGAGQVSAAKLFDLIDGKDSGRPMKFPNIVVAVDGTASARPAMYFKGGEKLADADFKVTVADATVASCELKNGILTVTGLKAGTTSASVTAGGETQDFTITVRKSSDNGWL